MEIRKYVAISRYLFFVSMETYLKLCEIPRTITSIVKMQMDRYCRRWSGKSHGSLVMSTVILHGQRQPVYILSMLVGLVEDSTSSSVVIIFSSNLLIL